MQKPPIRRKRRIASWKVIAFLLVCFPYGLFLMWYQSNWRMAAKSAITACFALLLVGVFLIPQTSSQSRSGGIELVGKEPEAEIYGPELPSSFTETYTSYNLGASGSVIAEVEPVEQTYVYANDNGKYYHTSTCEYTAWYSKQYELAVAYYSGYRPCPECGAETYRPG